MVHFYELIWLTEIFRELINWLQRFKEIINFNLHNPATIFFLLTLALSLSSAVALLKQSKKIRNKESGEAVSFAFYGFLIIPAFAVSLYGYYQLSLALFVNGLCIGSAGFFVIKNLLTYQKYPRWEKVLGFSAVISIPLVIAVSGYKDILDTLFFIFGLTVLFMLQTQSYAMWKKKSIGSLHIGPAINGLFSASSWLIYAFFMDLWPVKVFNIFTIISWSIFLVLYFSYKNNKITEINN
jgi:uncharacterized protein with PQ loop repeat